MSVKVKDIDRGFKRIMKELENASMDAHIDIGYFGEKKTADGEYTLVGIAAVQEFGTKPGTVPKIPERSFLRSTADARVSRWGRATEEAIGDMIDGKTDLVGALAAVGEECVGDVQEKITRLRTPPNAPSTIARKGTSNPLIHTGAMKNYCRARIVLAGTSKRIVEKE